MPRPLLFCLKSGRSVCYSVPDNNEFNAGEVARSIDRFLETLDKENRIMFVRRYWHSDSIADLRQYAAEHGLTVVDEYIDDGWSGTNFERPSFQRMIDDIEDGKINCVVTKDLSRLGRNYILTGQYTEIYFPSKGVRYIAINDNVDTINGESELAPFLNILNEMHARQTCLLYTSCPASGQTKSSQNMAHAV